MSGAKRVGMNPDEMRERAVRMLFEHQHEYPSKWKAIESNLQEAVDQSRDVADLGSRGRDGSESAARVGD